MAGIFKNIGKSDIRLSPFKVHKLWGSTLSGSSTYTLYQADYSSVSDYQTSDPLYVTFNQGVSDSGPDTANDKYKRVVHSSIDHLYYRNFYTNPKASFGGGDYRSQNRVLEDKAWVISMPQSKFGESILPESVKINVSWSLKVSSGSLFTTSSDTYASGVWTVLDDGLGNLSISGSGYYSPYGQYVGGAYTNYTSSVGNQLLGQWPFSELYKYQGHGKFSISSSYHVRGDWPLDTLYEGIQAVNMQSTSFPSASAESLLGTSLYFDGTGSRVRLGGPGDSDRLRRYNFENADFGISFIIRPELMPTTISGSTLLEKRGPEDQIRVDINGNIHSNPVVNRYPYRLYIQSGSNAVCFEKRCLTGELTSLTSSVALESGSTYHIAVSRQGSTVTLQVNSSISGSIDTQAISIAEKDCSNGSFLYIGDSYNNESPYVGYLDNLKIYNKALSSDSIKVLQHTLGQGSLHVGNVFYNNGIVVLGTEWNCLIDPQYMESRGTITIWETEVSCTVGPGEYNMSCNPTTQEYDSVYGEYVYQSFVTESTFKPYVTTVGLYDDGGNLLVVGKVNAPIKMPSNMDTTFILKFDR